MPTVGLEGLRTPFPADQIGRLPKPTRQQTEEVKQNLKAGERCNECGGWHHPRVVHLDYVGHASATNRLLDVDPEWNWEPMGVDDNGLPLLDKDGLLWIRLTVLGVTRIGCGDAEGKVGGNAMKERIGDAIRSAGMRFGMALDLWHKGDAPLHEVAELYTDKQKAYFDLAIERKLEIELFVFSKIIPGESYEALFASFKEGTKTAKKAEVRKLIGAGGAIGDEWINGIETAGGDQVIVKEFVESNESFVVDYIKDQLTPEAQAFFSEAAA